MAAALALKYELRSGLFIFNCLKNDTGMALVPWKSARGCGGGDDPQVGLLLQECGSLQLFPVPGISRSCGGGQRCWKVSCAGGSGPWLLSPGQGVTGGAAGPPIHGAAAEQSHLHPSRVIFHGFFSPTRLESLESQRRTQELGTKAGGGGVR